jgi:hypothetical protein
MHKTSSRLPKAGVILLACSVVTSACSDLPTDAADRSLTPSGAGALHSTSSNPTVAKVTIAFDSGSVDRKTWSIAAGTKEQFSATAYDASGRVITGRAVKFVSSNAASFRIDSTTGLGTAITAGTVSIKATIDGITGATGNFSVTGTATTTNTTPPSATPATPATPAPAPSPVPTPPPASSIAVQVVRFDGGSGAATVSAGVPLVPGALRPGQEGNVRVYVGGIEQPVYVTGVSSRHPDGSLRAVLVQFRATSLGSTPATGFIDLGTTRPAAMTLASAIVTPGTSASGTPAGLPQAAILPTSPSYLVSTDLVGPTLTSAATSALGGTFAKYEANFSNYSEALWAQEGAGYNEANYYDRALIYYAFWARTGNATYWARAGRMAYDYRVKYLEHAGYGSSPHWSQLEGVEKHYLLTGDEKSRAAVTNTAYMLQLAYLNSSYMTAKAGESRIAARVLHAQLLAWRLAPAGSPAITFRGTNMVGVNWGANVESAISKLVTWQKTDGSYPSGEVCGGQLNYMVGLLNDALIKTYDYYVPTGTSRTTLQGTIQTLVQKAADYMWSTQWIAGSGSFKYASVTCSGVGGTNASPDLNLLIVSGYGWLSKRTGNAKYVTQGDAIFATGVSKAMVQLTKQFNENYTSSFRYVGLR